MRRMPSPHKKSSGIKLFDRNAESFERCVGLRACASMKPSQEFVPAKDHPVQKATYRRSPPRNLDMCPGIQTARGVNSMFGSHRICQTNLTTEHCTVASMTFWLFSDVVPFILLATFQTLSLRHEAYCGHPISRLPADSPDSAIKRVILILPILIRGLEIY
jgi:hypothetical protein